MQEKNNSYLQPLCVCRRLFNFIINNLIPRGGFYKVTTSLDHPLPAQSSTDQAYHGMNHPDDSDSAILVHHKETDDLEHWTPVDSLDSSLYFSDHEDSTVNSGDAQEEEITNLGTTQKKAQVLHDEQIKETSAVLQEVSSSTITFSNNGGNLLVQGKDPKEVDATFTAINRKRSSGTEKMMGTIKDLVKKEKNGRKNKQPKNMREKLTLAVEADQELETTPPVRQVRPLFNVAMSINEKSDAFIRSRKAAMKNSYNLDTPYI
ncbi:hypothetical protein FNV43_RR23436 [Rhamnella rubrinervis]|uniref:Uncharacterized protein n=1 Tax=Rhamnella rubrinervis TaxID=2594499 RepID=A0A8K0GS28_9ROSA|nr:hypothetical protein FNV43_RR23436 [Rhamnella rubrinervis]